MEIPKIVFCTQRQHENRFNCGGAVGRPWPMGRYASEDLVLLDTPPDTTLKGWRVYGTEPMWSTSELDGSAEWHAVTLLQRGFVGDWESRLSAVQIFSKHAAALSRLRFGAFGPGVRMDERRKAEGSRHADLARLREAWKIPVVSFTSVVETKYGCLLRAVGVDAEFQPFDRLHTPRPSQEIFVAVARCLMDRVGGDPERAAQAYHSEIPAIQSALTGLSPNYWRRFCYRLGFPIGDEDLLHCVDKLFPPGERRSEQGWEHTEVPKCRGQSIATKAERPLGTLEASQVVGEIA